MVDKPHNPPDPPPEEKATPPPDDPRRRSTEWEDAERTPANEEEYALRRLRALRDSRNKQTP
ncbi:MAG: hypothetical protein IPP47_01515 [Bryobacterales bacterium]|nr:hypothetical protein [Bryobacterales bacterium]